MKAATAPLVNILLGDICRERTRQDDKFGPRGGMLAPHYPLDGGARYHAMRNLSILLEEVGEVAKEVNELHEPGAQQRLREELVQVAAVAVAWLECLDATRED